MKIDLLLKREPFPEILEKTLSSFLREWKGEEYQVRWKENPGFLKIRKDQGQRWVCNRHLNVIFHQGASRDIFDPIEREFSRSMVSWRRPLQRLYVSLATSSFPSRWLSHAEIQINPPIPEANGLLIVGGNNKIRILDANEQVAYGIKKIGFPSDFIQHEIRTRKKAEEAGLPVPELQEISEKGSWFSERYLSATPLNRLADQSRIDCVLKDLYQQLCRFYDQTQEEVLLTDYVERLFEQAKENITINPLIDSTLWTNLHEMLKRLSELISDLGAVIDNRIVTVLSHGDFQPANILVNAQGVWLIDWEYADRRQRGYDFLVYQLGSRFPKGLAHRAFSFLDEPGDCYPFIVDLSTDLSWFRSREGRRIHIALFLLEEFYLKIKENNNQQFYCLQRGFLDLYQEIRKSLRLFEELGF